MTEEQAKKLQEPFKKDEIEWRVLRCTKDKTRGQVAAYVDSRAIQNRLDRVLGRENWQNRFITVSGKDNDSTTHICEISVYYPGRNEWIAKSDGAGCTDIEPIKGGLSNAFKRAASMWGVGRYLYALKNIWVAVEDKAIADFEKPRLDEAYENFVKRLAKNSVSSTLPSAVPQKAENPEPERGEIPKGRFSDDGKEQPTVFSVEDLKYTQGANSPRTRITLKATDGKVLTGYIKGKPDLEIGQNVKDVAVTKKHSEVVGDYNIIEGYKLAA